MLQYILDLNRGQASGIGRSAWGCLFCSFLRILCYIFIIITQKNIVYYILYYIVLYYVAYYIIIYPTTLYYTFLILYYVAVCPWPQEGQASWIGGSAWGCLLSSFLRSDFNKFRIDIQYDLNQNRIEYDSNIKIY